MSTGPHVVECPICGHMMVWPSGQEKPSSPCAVCGVTIEAGGTASVPLLDDDDRPIRPKPTAQVKNAPQAPTLLTVLPWGLLCGLAGALAGGIVMAVIFYLRGKAGDSWTLAGFIISSDTGILGGFVLGASWVIIKRLAWGPFRGMALGCCLGITLGVLCYLLEWGLITKPDQSIVEVVVVAVLGGSVVGVVLGEKVGRPADD